MTKLIVFKKARSQSPLPSFALPLLLSPPPISSSPSSARPVAVCCCSGEYATRRSFLTAAIAAAFLLPINNNSRAADLPAGAAEFSRILTAQTRWNELGGSIRTNADTLDNQEWNDTRTYLRAIYSIGSDMRYVLKNSKESKQLAIKFEATVKAMDEPCKNHDARAFLSQHAQVNSLIDDFFQLYKQVSIGDIPDEL